MRLIQFLAPPSSGYWTISDGTHTTAPLAYNASASVVGSAMDAASLSGGPYTSNVTGDYSAGFTAPTTQALTATPTPATPSGAVTITETQLGGSGVTGSPSSFTLTASGGDGSSITSNNIRIGDWTGAGYSTPTPTGWTASGNFNNSGDTITLTANSNGPTSQLTWDSMGMSDVGANPLTLIDNGSFVAGTSDAIAQDEIQQLAIAGYINGGTFDLTLPDSTVLSAVPWNVDDGTLQGLITGGSSYTSATVSGLAIDYGVQTSLTLATVDGSGLVVQPLIYDGFSVSVTETQAGYAGTPSTFTLTPSGSIIGSPNWTVGDWTGSVNNGPMPTGWTADQALINGAINFTSTTNGVFTELTWDDSGLGGVTVSDGGSYAAGTAPANEIQQLTIPGAVNGGTFDLTFPDATSFSGMAWNISDGDLQTDIRGSSSYTSATVIGLVIDYGVQTSLSLTTADGSALFALDGIDVAAFFEGSAADAESASGDLTVVPGMSGTAIDADSCSGALTVKRLLASSVNDAESCAAPLKITRLLVGAAGEADSVAGSLKVTRSLAGSALDAESTTAILQSGVQLAGIAAEAESASGDLTVTRFLVGSAGDADSVIADLTIVRTLTGSALDAESAFSGFVVTRLLVGSAGDAESTRAPLTVQRQSRYQLCIVGEVLTHGLMAGMITT